MMKSLQDYSVVGWAAYEAMAGLFTVHTTMACRFNADSRRFGYACWLRSCFIYSVFVLASDFSLVGPISCGVTVSTAKIMFRV